MPIELHKEGDHYVLSADLPGVDPGSIDVSVDGQVLTIRAERTARATTESLGSRVSVRPAATCAS